MHALVYHFCVILLRLYPQENGDFTYVKTGRKHVITTWYGVKITHSGFRYILEVPSFYDNSTVGICMNKDGNKFDDYTTKNGTILSFPPQRGYKRTWQEYEVAESFVVGSTSLRGCMQYDEDLGNEEITGIDHNLNV